MIRKLAAAAIAALASLLLGLSPAMAQSQSSIDIVNGAGVHTKLGVNACGTDTGVTVLCYKFVLVDTSNSPFDPATKQLQQSMITALGSPAQDSTLATANALATTANSLLTTANGLLAAANAANATYIFKKPGGASESSAAASYTFVQTGQRALYAVCQSTGSATFTDANGGTIAWPLVSGGQFLPFLATGFSGNTAGCTIGLLF